MHGGHASKPCRLGLISALVFSMGHRIWYIEMPATMIMTYKDFTPNHGF
jgi:hypothetical protein